MSIGFHTDGLPCRERGDQNDQYSYNTDYSIPTPIGSSIPPTEHWVFYYYLKRLDNHQTLIYNPYVFINECSVYLSRLGIRRLAGQRKRQRLLQETPLSRPRRRRVLGLFVSPFHFSFFFLLFKIMFTIAKLNN